MDLTEETAGMSGAIAGANCNPEDVEQRTFVLLRPGNQFYDLEDSVLNQLFGNTWVRTDRSTSQFILEFPVCTIDTSLDALKEKGEALIRSVEALLSEEGRVPEDSAAYLGKLIETMQKASDSEEYRKAYDALLQEYNRLIAEPEA